MNILVTGANGQLGNEMRIVAKESQDNYIFTDVNQVEGVETTYLDITDLQAIKQMVAANKVDVIVNCAAYTNVDAAESNEALAEKLNADAPENLAKAMKEAKGLLVQISTDYVFGKEPYNIPCKEDQQGTPTGVYGQTKLHGEQKIKTVGCKHIIIRTAWLYSEFGKNFCKTMMNLTATKPQLKVVFDQCGTPTYAFDLAETIAHILDDYKCENDNEEYGKSGIYHYSNEGVWLLVRLYQDDSGIQRYYRLRHPAVPQQRVSQSGEKTLLLGIGQDKNQESLRVGNTLLDGFAETMYY